MSAHRHVGQNPLWHLRTLRHGFEKDEQRQERLINIIKEYGCGSCGPRNFYGGTLEHVKLEEELKKFVDENGFITFTRTSCKTNQNINASLEDSGLFMVKTEEDFRTFIVEKINQIILQN